LEEWNEKIGASGEVECRIRCGDVALVAGSVFAQGPKATPGGEAKEAHVLAAISHSVAVEE